MACNTRFGPAAAIRFFEQATGVKLTQEDWHLIREATESAQGGKLSRGRADVNNVGDVFQAFTEASWGKLGSGTDVPRFDRDEFKNEFVDNANTQGTLDMLSFMTANGLPETVTSRIRRGGGKSTGTTVPPKPTVVSSEPVSQCAACGQFTSEAHICPPGKLREYAVSEDTATAKLYNEQWNSGSTLFMYAEYLHSMNGEDRVYINGGYGYLKATNVTLMELREKVAKAETGGAHALEGFIRVTDAAKRLTEYDAEKTNHARLQELIDEANDRYGAFEWNRAFLVVTNGDGHVHKSMVCSTCYPTTRFNWRPEMSGSDETDIVEAAGERACTICYPTAPVDVLARATTIFSEEELDKKKAREERAVAKLDRDAVKRAKAPTLSGEPLRVVTGYRESSRQPGLMLEESETFKTEVTARQWVVEHLSEDYYLKQPLNMRSVEEVVASLAEKHGMEKETLLSEFEAKAAIKRAKYEKEVERYRISREG